MGEATEVSRIERVVTLDTVDGADVTLSDATGKRRVAISRGDWGGLGGPLALRMTLEVV